jgi:hypothetical protein
VADITPPEDTETLDGYALKFSLVHEAKSGFYKQHYGGEGDCIVLVRYMPDFDGPDISTGGCVGIALSLIIAAVVVAACIIFLLPKLVVKEEAKDAKDAEDAEPVQA